MDLCLIGESWWLVPANVIALGKAIIGLGVVIFVHELGHFLVAKACGVKCEKFYLGFDVPIRIGPVRFPAALWKKQIGETEYGIGTIPLGGYVKMLGQDDNPANAAAEAQRIREMSDDGQKVQLDPRSYPAKSVPQRMAIISAGVIMNLIFAVIFAAIAYLMGLSYTPAIVGSTMPGESAWQANMRPGDQMVRLGKDGRRDEKLRFRDLHFNVIKSDEHSFDVLVKRPDGSEHDVSVRPVARKGEFGGLAKIGVISASSLTVHRFDVDRDSAVAHSTLKSSDVIDSVVVGKQGTRIPVSEFLDLKRVMLKFPDQPLTLRVHRPVDLKAPDAGDEEVDVVLEPQPEKDVGFFATMGPIVGVQDDSPATAAGFQVGDVMQAIDGQPIDDPFQIDFRLRSAQSAVTFTVLRNGQPVDLTVQPRALDMDGQAGRPGGPVAAVSLGVAYDVLDVVAAVTEGGPAEAAGLQVGDTIVGARFVQHPNANVDRSIISQLRLNEPMSFEDDRPDWAYANKILQHVPKGMDVKLTCRRGSKEVEVVIPPGASASAFVEDRGLATEIATRIRKADSLREALQLGVRETKEAIAQVFIVLRRIGKLYKHLGGPGTIAVAATGEASEGMARLLAFLTVLSANLAVLNFLPIPVLDGGHMMFLAYEGIFGRPMNERIAFAATMVGLCLVLCLMVFVIGLDVFRFTGLLGSVL